MPVPARFPRPEKRSPLPPLDVTTLAAALDAHAMLAIADAKGRLTYVNDQFCAISKYSRRELLTNEHGIFDSSQPGETASDIWARLDLGEIWRGEIRNRTKSGIAYWVSSTIIPIVDENGTSRRFVVVQADITEQKRAEAELVNGRRMQGLLSQLSARFVALPTSKVDAAIQEVQRLIVESMDLDRSTLWQIADNRSDLVLTHFWQRVDWSQPPAKGSTDRSLPWSHAQLMRGESIGFESLDDLPPDAHPDREAFQLQQLNSNVTIPLTSNGRTFGALAFGTLGRERKWRKYEIAELHLIAQIIGNVVARQRAELREEQLRSEVTHANRVATLGELLAALAHDLNQPLTAILSNAQAARRMVIDETITPGELCLVLDDLIRDDKRASDIIHYLRTMVSKSPSVPEKCCLNQIVREVIELMRSEWIGENIQVRFRLAPDLPAVEAARVEMQQVLVNLLVNSAQAMKGTARDKRYIEVESGSESGLVALHIRDHGHGIPSEALPDVFQPFSSTKSDGLGLGLSICRRIVESHGGRIAASNAEGGGARFSIALPAAGARG